METKPLKICFISHSGGMRGAELALLEAIEGLLPLRVIPVVFVPEEGVLASRLRDKGIECIFYSAIPWVTTRRTLLRSIGKTIIGAMYTIRLAGKLRKQNCQVVYSNSLSIGMGAWAASIIRVPHVWHIHEFGYEDHKLVYDCGERFARWVYMNLGGYFIINSEAVAAKYTEFLGVSFFQKRHTVIYQAVTIPDVDASFVAPESKYEVVLILTGALHVNKGQADAISATYQLQKEGISIGLILLGDGEDRRYFEKFASDLKIRRDIHFIGMVENVSNWLALADVALVCSKLEAFGRVAVEAMLSKIPVVAAKSGGLNEIVVHGETGLQYEPGDVDDLVKNIKTLIENKETAKEISEKAYKWANENFNKKKYGREICQTIKLNVLKG